ncbi:MAG: LEM-3-like GIY-YIG domain-containing protein [Micrococcales bacterium]
MSKITIPFDTRKALGYYVYALRDPKTKEVFYIGKGKGERIIQHVVEAKNNPKSEKAKLKRIKEIEARGQHVDHLFIRTGIKTEAEAFAIEQAVIDSYKANRNAKDAAVLTNLVAGHEASEKGLASLDTVLARHAAPRTPRVDRPILVLKLNQFWQPDMNSNDLLQVSRGYWRVGKQVREQAEVALVIAYGVIRGVYEIDRQAWKPATEAKFKGKWIFDGVPTSDKSLKALIGSDMGSQVRNQVSIQKYLQGFVPKK